MFTEDYWCPTEDSSSTAVADTAPAVTGALWIALMKLCNGDGNIAPAERDWLVADRLIETKDGVNTLTPRGLTALGLTS